MLMVVLPGYVVRSRLDRPALLSSRGLSPFGFAPGGEIGERLLIRCRIESKNAAALLDFLRDKILERGHLESLVRDLVGEMRGDHDHAVAIAEDDVAGKHRRVARADPPPDL